jgi:hypothetical protein
MRHDILQDGKSIHIKMNKETHTALRALLFQHGISMQEVFGECANQVTNKTKVGISIIESIVTRKLRAALDGTSLKTKKKESFSELDSDSIYNLINSGKDS